MDEPETESATTETGMANVSPPQAADRRCGVVSGGTARGDQWIEGAILNFRHSAAVSLSVESVGRIMGRDLVAAEDVDVPLHLNTGLSGLGNMLPNRIARSDGRRAGSAGPIRAHLAGHPEQSSMRVLGRADAFEYFGMGLVPHVRMGVRMSFQRLASPSNGAGSHASGALSRSSRRLSGAL